jgi:hypothetical protein
MGERANNIIEKTVSYDLPDDYLSQTSENKLTGTFTYNGPDQLWVFVDNSTSKLVGGGFWTEHDDGDLIPTPEGQTKVLLSADNDGVLMSMIYPQGYVTGPTKTEVLPDGSEYVRLDPTPPDHTYELMEIEYDLQKKEWKQPYPWKKPHMDWDTLKSARTAMLRESDFIIKNNILSNEDLTKLEEYRQKLRDIPTTFAGIDPWKIPFPPMPIDL